MSYQQDLKDLRKKITDLDLENKQLKRDLEQARKDSEAALKLNSENRLNSINTFSKMLTRLEKQLETYVGEVGEVIEAEHR